MPVIEVANLTKEFRVPSKDKPSSFGEKVGRFFKRKWDVVPAVNDISFSVEKGEAVAFIGPNGAGKTSTIKILTGILTPTSGEVSVAGFDPHRQRYDYTYHIGLVMGQKSMLIWDIPVIESLRLYRDIYELNQREFSERVDVFSEIIGIKDLLHIPVRKLSLGQRMRAEIVSSLLHKPEVIFLDEPTIGLDIVAKRKVLDFIKETNKSEAVTILLTTHDISEIKQVCQRVILIDKGIIIYDGSLEALEQICKYQIIDFKVKNHNGALYEDDLFKSLQCEENGKDGFSIKVDNGDLGKITQILNSRWAVDDLSVHPPDLESILRDIYEGTIDV